ncbi:MAG TPA: hypothetical protein VEL11_15410 [Candidatus Bathyarchaeia archaeon]|nr:hypothetical protein [Candidatus Bathyarchaeia archaeon]
MSCHSQAITMIIVVKKKADCQFRLDNDASTKEIFISLKRNGFDISLLEVENMLGRLVEEGFIQRDMPSLLE